VKSKKLTFVIDIDGTLTYETDRPWWPEKYVSATPKVNAIDMVRKLHSLGHIIILHTGRRKEDRKVTEHWLAIFGVSYDKLIMGKPVGDYYLDNKNASFSELHKIISKEG